MAKQFICRPGAAEAQTRQGVIRGYVFDGLTIFKGVPYAKARRFHRPEPADAWEGVRECTSCGYTCPIAAPGRPQGELLVPHRYWAQSEDCQNLNLWTPGLDDHKRPVLVWLHGGGFTDGSAIEQIAYDGANLARRGDAVVVTVNHRLNILGYLDLSDFGEEYENSGNAGTDDLIFALRWVRDNIAAFGGDPDNVTVFGQSGGGAKVTALLQSPEADGLFHRGINMSGVIGPVLADALGSGRLLAETLMQELGVKSVQAMEETPYAVLRAAYDKVRPMFRQHAGYVGCAPHPNRFYLGEPVINGFRQESAHVPLMVGSVFGEFNGFFEIPGFPADMPDAEAKAALTEALGRDAEDMLALFRAAYPDHPLRDLVKLDTVFRRPEIRYIQKRAALNGCTYAYLFDASYSLNGRTVAWHCADLPYVFANCGLVEYTHQPGMETLEDQIVESVLAFARTGDPNNALIPRWQPCAPDCEHTMIFGPRTHAAVNFDHELVDRLSVLMEPALQRLMESRQGKIQH